MAKSRAALSLVVLLACTTANAAGVNMRWSSCFGDGGAMNKVFACGSCAGSNLLVGSFVLDAGREQVTGVKIVVDIATDSPTLPAWWQMVNAGSCRQNALSVNTVAPGTAVSCADWANGFASAGAKSYTVGYSGPNTARLTCRLDVPTSAAAALVAGQEYFAANVAISGIKTVGTGSCPDCTVPACVAMSAIRLYQADTPVVTTITGPANGTNSNYVTWQGGGSLSGGCAIPDSTGFPLITSIVGRGTVVRTRDDDIYPAGTPVTLAAVPLVGARFAAWSGDTATVQDTLAVVMNGPLSYVATFEQDPVASPHLTAVDDVPGDQGSFVTVRWEPSAIDTGTVPGLLCCYDIQRRAVSPPGAPWSSIDNVAATSASGYSHVVTTPADSTLIDPAVFSFCVIAQANADTAQWISNVADGHSVDNLAPPAPASVGGVIASGFASLSWPAVAAPSDFGGYHVFRGPDESMVLDDAHLIGTTTATRFNDSPGFFVHYRVASFDVHGNNSPGTLFVPFNPADVPGKPAPRIVSVGSPSPSPMARSMSMTLGLPRAMPATVDVLDSQGRLVRRLSQGEKPAGWVTLSWDARDAGGRESAAGMYFVRVLTPEGRCVKRLVLVP